MILRIPDSAIQHFKVYVGLITGALLILFIVSYVKIRDRLKKYE